VWVCGYGEVNEDRHKGAGGLVGADRAVALQPRRGVGGVQVEDEDCPAPVPSSIALQALHSGASSALCTVASHSLTMMWWCSMEMRE